jgi:hypothetical protein
MRIVGLCVLQLALAAFSTACGGEVPDDKGEDESDVGIARSALVGGNALSYNALNLNALNLNALNLNALNVSAMSATNLSAIRDPGSNGTLARQLVKYAVSCALDPTQFFSFSWTDGSSVVHNETYPGLLGLAPPWTSRALTTNEEEWISACLASRINWYETPVPLSARGATGALNETCAEERTTWTREEGSFWGNLFADSPYAFACHHVPNVSYSRSQLRDCAAGHLDAAGVPQDCGMVHILGSCDSFCNAINTQGYRAKCTAPGRASTNAVVTIHLQ